MAVRGLQLFASLLILGSSSLACAASAPQPPTSGAHEYIKTLTSMYKNGTYISYRDLMLRQLQKGEFDLLDQYYNALQAAYSRGEINDIVLFSAYAPFADMIDPINVPYIDQWLAQSPQSYPAHFIKVRYLISAAWEARGGSYAYATEQDRLDLFSRILKLAWVANEASVDLTDKPVLSLSSRLKMLRAASSLGYSEEDKYKLAKSTLHQAQAMDNSMFWPRYNYMTILTPRWSGINDDYATMSEFVSVVQKEGAPDFVVQFLNGMISQDIGDAYYDAKNYKDSTNQHCHAATLQAGFIDYPFGQESLKKCIRSTYYSSWDDKKHDPDSREYLDMLNALLANGHYVEDAGWFYGARGQIRWNLDKDAPGAWDDYNAGAALGDAHSIYNVARIYCYGLAELAISTDPQKCVTMMGQAAEGGAKITNEDVRTVKRLARKIR